MFNSEQNVLKVILSNYGSLFATIGCGTLNWHTMFFQTNLETSLSLMLA